jgi:hypothetical protein
MPHENLRLMATLVPHIPFAVVYLVVGAVAVFRFSRAPSRMTWLLVGLVALAAQRFIEVWITVGIPTDVSDSAVEATANYIKTWAYLSWALAVWGFCCVAVAALKSDVRKSMGAMPNKSLERTREG